MLNFILVAGYNSLEPVDTLVYCKGRMEEHIKQFKRKYNLQFYFVDFKEGKITLQKVSKGGKKLALTVVKQFAPLEATLRGKKNDELDKLIKAEDVFDLILTLEEYSLLRVEFFYTHALSEDELPLLYFKKDDLIYTTNLDTLSIRKKRTSNEDRIGEVSHDDLEYWVWNLKPYAAKKIFGLNTFLKIEPFAKLNSGGYYSGDSQIPLKLFNDEEFERLKKYIPVQAYPYETYGKFKEYDHVTGLRREELIYQLIDRENGKVSLEFLSYFFLPEGGFLIAKLYDILDWAIYFKVGSKPLIEDKFSNLLFAPVDVQAERMNKLLFRFEIESTHHFSKMEYESVHLQSDYNLFVDMHGTRFTKSMYVNILDYKAFKPFPEPAYQSKEKLDLSGFYGKLFSTDISSKKVKNYIVVEGVPFRQNYDIPLEFAQAFMMRSFGDLNFSKLTDEYINAILAGLKQDEGVLVFTIFSPLYSSIRRELFSFDSRQSRYLSSPIEWVDPPPLRPRDVKFYSEFNGKYFRADYGTFKYNGDGYYYYHAVDPEDNSIIVKQYDSDIYFEVTDNFRDALLSIEAAFRVYDDLSFWESVEFPAEFKNSEKSNRFYHLNDRPTLLWEKEFEFTDPKSKSFRVMNMFTVYKLIELIGKYAPLSLQKLIFSCETNDLNPTLLNAPIVKSYALAPTVEDDDFFEPGSSKGLRFLDSFASRIDFQKAWASDDEKSHIIFCRSQKIYLKIIKCIITSKEYHSDNLTSETIITLKNPSRLVKKFLEDKAGLIKNYNDPYFMGNQIYLEKASSSTVLNLRYKLGDLLRFFSDLIKSSYSYHLASASQKAVITCLPGLGMNFWSANFQFTEERSHKIKNAPSYTNKYALFYKRHFGIERSPTEILNGKTKLNSNYRLFLFNANNQFTLDPKTDWFKGTGLESVKF